MSQEVVEAYKINDNIVATANNRSKFVRLNTIVPSDTPEGTMIVSIVKYSENNIIYVPYGSGALN